MAVRRLLIAGASLLATTGLVTTGLCAPAHAASGQISSRSATLYKGCFSHPFRYALSGVADGWTLTVDLVAAGGRRVDRAVVPASNGAAGYGAFRLCAGTVRPGTYTVRSRVTWPSGSGHPPLTLATTGLSLRRPVSTTKVSVSTKRPRLKKKVRVTATVRVARPYGMFVAPGVRAKLKVRHQGRWRALGTTKTTNKNGVLTWRVRWRYPNPKKIRVVTPRSVYHARSASRVVVITSKAPRTKG